jgi:hypothetical protein
MKQMPRIIADFIDQRGHYGAKSQSAGRWPPGPESGWRPCFARQWANPPL